MGLLFSNNADSRLDHIGTQLQQLIDLVQHAVLAAKNVTGEPPSDDSTRQDLHSDIMSEPEPKPAIEEMMESTGSCSIQNESFMEEHAASTEAELCNDLAVSGQAENSNLEEHLKSIEQHLGLQEYKDRIIKDLHTELQQYKSGLRNEFTRPLIKRMLQWYDSIIDCSSFYADKEYTSENYRLMLDAYRKLGDGVEDLIYEYDIEPFAPRLGDPYNPKQHHAVEILPTKDDCQHKTIARIYRSGFEDVISRQIIRPAQVSVYKKSE